MQGSTDISEDNIREQAKKDGVTHFSTGVAVVKDGKVLLARRVASDSLGGMYELPGGGVDEGEAITEGAIRETKEETGLTVSKIVGMFDGFDYATNRKPHVRQVNFLVEVEPGDVVLNPEEHDDYVWVDAHSLDGLNVSAEMRHCVEAVFPSIRSIT